MTTTPDQTIASSSRAVKGIRLVEYVGLVTVLIATIVAGVSELVQMFRIGTVGISDLLLLFMYLEMISMVEAYWRMGKLPVRMPLYIAMVGIARRLMVDSAYHSPWMMIASAGSIVLLALGVLIVRYGHLHFPYDQTGRISEPDPQD